MKKGKIFIEEERTPDPNLQLNYTISIYGDEFTTTVTRRPRVVRQWIHRIHQMNRFRYARERFIVGLGVQWRPQKGEAATIQLCVGTHCLIFQIAQAGSIPQKLIDFLEDRRVTFIGVRNYTDEIVLDRNYPVTMSRVWELGEVAGMKGTSMEKMASQYLGFLGVKKPMWIGRSDWEQWELDIEQVQYAAVDAYLSFQIGKRLRAWKYKPTESLIDRSMESSCSSCSGFSC